MTAETARYTKLAGFGRDKKSPLLWGAASLWLGEDHLLSVKTWGFREEYRRFYFDDIQAISVRRTNRWMWSGAVAGVFLAGCLVAALALGAEREAQITFFVLAALPAVLLAWNLALGPSCLTTATTAVQTEELSALNRVRQVERVMEKVRPLIWAAQRKPAGPEAPGIGGGSV